MDGPDTLGVPNTLDHFALVRYLFSKSGLHGDHGSQADWPRPETAVEDLGAFQLFSLTVKPPKMPVAALRTQT